MTPKLTPKQERLLERCLAALESGLITGFGPYYEDRSVTKWTIDKPTDSTSKKIHWLSDEELDQYLTGLGC